MTDQQLYLSIGIPTLAVLVAILVNIGYFVAINGRLNTLETRLDGRIDNLAARFETLDAKFDTKFELLLGKVFELDNRLTRIEEQLRH